jgi:DNA ligase-1
VVARMTTFKPMLAHSKSPDPESLDYPVLVQPKLDGIRAVVKDGRLLSRSLKPIPNASIRATLEDAAYEGLDGELVVGPPTAADCYRRTCSFVMAEDKTEEEWTFYVFDKHDHEAVVEERVRVISELAFAEHPNIEPVVTAAIENADELAEVEAVYLEAGFEGGIIRIPGSAYKFGRSGKRGPLLKLKRYIDYEAEVVKVIEELHNGNEARTNELGRTERSSHAANKTGKGTMGALTVVALNGPHEGAEFRVGTGFTADVRAELWEERDFVVGRVAKIKSFPVGTKDRPRHPVWLGWRDLEVDG